MRTLLDSNSPLFFVCMTLLSGQAAHLSAQQLEEPRTVSDREAPAAELVTKYSDAWNRRDADQLASLFAPDASQFDVFEREARGRSEIHAVYKRDGDDRDIKGTLKLLNKANTLAGDNFIVASGDVLFLGEDGLPRGKGHYMIVISQHDKEQLLTDLRLAFNWRQPRDSATVNAIDPNAVPPIVNCHAEIAAPAKKLAELLSVQSQTQDTANAFVASPHLVDVDGNIFQGVDGVVRELRNRGGSRCVSVTRGTVRGNVAILDGVLLSQDNGLSGLPTVYFTAVYEKSEDQWRFVAQFNRAPLAHLMNAEFWAVTIESFEELDKRTQPPPGGIVFVGDSDIVRCDVDRWFPGLGALNRGFGGSHIDQVVYYLEQVLLKHQPRIVVFSCGGNDIATGKAPERVYRDFEQFVNGVFAKLPDCWVIVTSQHTPPILSEWNDFDERIRKFNDLVRWKAELDKRITFLPETRSVLRDDADKPDANLFAPDRLHFNEEGYRKWTAVIAPYLTNSHAR